MTCGTYVEAKFTSMTNFNLANFSRTLEIPNPVEPEKYHTTIVYSRNEIDWTCKSNLDEWVRPVALDIWKTRGGEHCLVLKVHSFYLQDRFNLAMSMGASYDFDNYIPHVTLSYDVGENFIIPIYQVPQFPLIINREEKETLKS